jgi:hypothetical protein
MHPEAGGRVARVHAAAERLDPLPHPDEAVASSDARERRQLLARAAAVLDVESNVVRAPAQGHGRVVARRVAQRVRERLLRGAVERKARVGGQRPRLALDLQVHVEVEPAEAGDESRELVDRSRVAPQRADRAPGIGEALPRELHRARESLPDGGRGTVAAGEQPRALELDRPCRQRVGKHVVQLARDAAALGDRGGVRLGVAGVLEPREEHLDLVAALVRLPHGVRRDRQHETQKRGSRNRLGDVIARQSDHKIEPGDDRRRDRSGNSEWEPCHRDENGDARRDVDESVRMQGGQREARSADHERRQELRPGRRAFPFAPERRSDPHGVRRDRERDGEPGARQPCRGIAERRGHGDDGDGDPAERSQPRALPQAALDRTAEAVARGVREDEPAPRPRRPTARPRRRRCARAACGRRGGGAS